MKITSLKEAIKNNLTHYYTGKPCKRGHLSKRLVSGRKCCQCHDENQKARTVDGRNRIQKTNIRSDETRRNKINEYERLRRSTSDTHKENHREYQRSDKYKTYRRKYQSTDKYLKYRRAYNKYRYRNDPNYKCGVICHQMVRKVLKMLKQRKNINVKSILDYTPNDLKLHIESQFTSGMTWGNHGEWHIDHIYPVAMMIENGIKNPNQINCLLNLTPKWAFDNISKGARFVG